jgi:hypothetical protein
MLYLFLLLNDCLIQPTATTTSVVSASSASFLPTQTQVVSTRIVEQTFPAPSSTGPPGQSQPLPQAQPLAPGPQGGVAAVPVELLSANAVGHVRDSKINNLIDYFILFPQLYIGNSNYLAPRRWIAILRSDNEGSFIRKISRMVCRNGQVRYTVTGMSRTVGGLPVVPLTEEIKKSIKGILR